VSAGFTAAQGDSKNTEKSKDAPVEVKANVKVLDGSGNYVNDLKLENLKIFEDGVEQKITYFARKEPVLNLGLVIDNTGSMRPQLDRLIRLGGGFVDSLGAKDEAFAVRFVSSQKIEVVQEWTADKFRLKRGLENMYIEGGLSAVIDALYLSSEKLLEREQKDKSKRYALVLISDAEDRHSFYKTEEMLARLKDTDIQIFVIAITSELAKNRTTDPSQARKPKATAEKLAQRLSFETGGGAYVLGAKYTDEDLANITKLIMDEIRSQYVVGYKSTNKSRDGSARKLRVQIADGEKGEKRPGFIRESFVVPKE
jgi:Ca-activated chloride channel family protein